jgi:hypothetical protein
MFSPSFAIYVLTVLLAPGSSQGRRSTDNARIDFAAGCSPDYVWGTTQRCQLLGSSFCGKCCQTTCTSNNRIQIRGTCATSAPNGCPALTTTRNLTSFQWSYNIVNRDWFVSDCQIHPYYMQVHEHRLLRVCLIMLCIHSPHRVDNCAKFSNYQVDNSVFSVADCSVCMECNTGFNLVNGLCPPC